MRRWHYIVGGGLLGLVAAWGAWRGLAHLGAKAIAARLAANARIPREVRRWADVVAPAAIGFAPDDVGAERWAYTILGLFDRESDGDPAAHGDSGSAHGLGQVHDRWWPEFAALSEEEKHDPATNAWWTARILRGEWDHWTRQGYTGGALALALASYNAGRKNVRAALAAGLPSDTFTTGANYGDDVLARAAGYGMLDVA